MSSPRVPVNEPGQGTAQRLPENIGCRITIEYLFLACAFIVVPGL